MKLQQTELATENDWNDRPPDAILYAWDRLMTQLDTVDTSIRNELFFYFNRLWNKVDPSKICGIPKITMGPLQLRKGAWGVAIIELPQMYLDDLVAHWPHEVIEALIAHEVAHFYHMAIKCVNPIEKEEETAVDKRIETWGYDPRIIDVCSVFQQKIGTPPTWAEVQHHRKHGRPLIERDQTSDMAC